LFTGVDVAVAIVGIVLFELVRKRKRIWRLTGVFIPRRAEAYS
jgi:hypothetical protein